MKTKITRNVLLIALMLIVGTRTVKAQFSGGVRGGLNFANASLSGDAALDPNQSKSTRTSIMLGGYGYFQLKKGMGLQAELFYSGEGFKISDTNSTDTYRLNFISLPLFFRYNINDNFHLLVGPQFSFLVAAKRIGGTTTTDISNITNSIGVGLVPAIGYDFNKYNFGLRYNIGLTNMANWPSPSTANIKSNVFEVVVGYKLF